MIMELGELVPTVSLFIMQLYKLMEIGDLVPILSLLSLYLYHTALQAHGAR